MIVESRIFSVADYVQLSEGEPIRSVVLETRAVIAGEARRNGQTPKAEPLRWAKRWNKCGPA